MKTIMTILIKEGYIIVLLILFVAMFLLYSLIPNMSEVSNLSRLDTDFNGDGQILIQGLLALMVHSGEGTLLPVLLLSLASALAMTLMVKYYKVHGKFLISSGGAGVLGAVAGVLGIGCVACGTLALTTVLGLFGLGFVIRFLPFGGIELYYMSIVLILVSIIQLIYIIKKPLVCTTGLLISNKDF